MNKSLLLCEADEYFDKHARFRSWFSFSPEDRQNALTQAEREVTPYRSWAQGAVFSYAVCEQALYILQPSDRQAMRQDGVQSYAIGALSEQFTTAPSFCPSHISPKAWRFLRGIGVRLGAVK